MNDDTTLAYGSLGVISSFKITVNPIKAPAEYPPIPVEKLDEQAELARKYLVAVDYHQIRGTCIDERARIGLRAGGSHTEPRPSVPGGPNIYALGVAELTGYFGASNEAGESRLKRITDRLNVAGIKSGGHEKCAANAGFGVWMQTIASESEYIKTYARLRFGEGFDERIMDGLVEHARQIIASGVYVNWNEDVLISVLGEAVAAEAIERLAKVEHGALTLVRNWNENTTVDQTAIYKENETGVGIGNGSFVSDEAYADTIEHIIASGPDAVTKKVEAEYAREAILAAVAAAVPNKQLYQIDLQPAKA